MSPSRPFAVQWLAAPVAGLVALGGCSSAAPGDPPATPSSSGPTSTLVASATSTASSAPAASTTVTAEPVDLSDPVVAALPPAARANSKTGAIAFGRFYVSQIGAMLAGKEVLNLRRLYSKECRNCVPFIRGVERVRDEGTTKRNPIKVTYAGIEFTSGRGQVMRTEFVVAPLTTYSRSGASTSKLRAQKVQLRFEIVFDGHWRLVDETPLLKSPTG